MFNFEREIPNCKLTNRSKSLTILLGLFEYKMTFISFGGFIAGIFDFWSLGEGLMINKNIKLILKITFFGIHD